MDKVEIVFEYMGFRVYSFVGEVNVNRRYFEMCFEWSDWGL